MIAAVFTFFLVLIVGAIFGDIGLSETGYVEWGSLFAIATASAMIIAYCRPKYRHKKKAGEPDDGSNETLSVSDLRQKALDELRTLPDQDLPMLLTLMERLKK